MMTRTLTRMVMAAALVCGTIAWTGWAYLNTVAAPHRVEDVANAVVADPEARFELAGPLADQIVERTGVDPAYTAQIRDAVANALADPRVSANVAAAFGSMHARAVGVDDERPSTIDGAILVAALRDHVSVANPELVALVPDTAIGNLEIPEFHPPLVSSLRSIAVTVTNWLALAALALFVCALIIGDRKFALRRFGVWAILTGLVWAIGPRLIVFLAHRWTTDADATIDAAVGAATRVVTATATGLVVAGLVAIVVAQFVSLGQRLDSEGVPIDARSSPRQPPPSRTVVASARTPPPPRPPGHTYEPTSSGTPVAGQARTAAIAAPAARPAERVPGDGRDAASAVQPAPAVSWSPPPPDPNDVDPWAIFSGPAVPPPPPTDR